VTGAHAVNASSTASGPPATGSRYGEGGTVRVCLT
jgi:hypothetical protein